MKSIFPFQPRVDHSHHKKPPEWRDVTGSRSLLKKEPILGMPSNLASIKALTPYRFWLCRNSWCKVWMDGVEWRIFSTQGLVRIWHWGPQSRDVPAEDLIIFTALQIQPRLYCSGTLPTLHLFIVIAQSSVATALTQNGNFARTKDLHPAF